MLDYDNLSRAFAKVKDLDVQEVGEFIGAKVKYNIDQGIFKNACAIRLSYAFNYGGNPIQRTDGAVISGADNKWYMYRVKDMVKYLNRFNLRTVSVSSISELTKPLQRGIILFDECGWGDATGHIDLFNGLQVEGRPYPSCKKIELYIIPA